MMVHGGSRLDGEWKCRKLEDAETWLTLMGYVKERKGEGSVVEIWKHLKKYTLAYVNKVEEGYVVRCFD